MTNQRDKDVMPEDAQSEDVTFRDEFGALRAEVGSSGTVPDFDSMMMRARAEVVTKARSRRRLSNIGGWVSLATAAAAAGILLLGNPQADADAEFERLVAAYSADLAAGGLESPTAVLLDGPGLDLAAVPSVGSTLRGLDRDAAPGRNGPEGRDS